jgi:hypothetical protein
MRTNQEKTIILGEEFISLRFPSANAHGKNLEVTISIHDKDAIYRPQDLVDIVRDASIPRKPDYLSDTSDRLVILHDKGR